MDQIEDIFWLAEWVKMGIVLVHDQNRRPPDQPEMHPQLIVGVFIVVLAVSIPDSLLGTVRKALHELFPSIQHASPFPQPNQLGYISPWKNEPHIANSL